MRTTITLDDDVAARLQTKVRKSGKSFKDVVNETLRTALAAESARKQFAPVAIDKQHLIRLKPGPNYDKVEEVFDSLDTPGRSR
jgi:plasmid stability protein